MKKKRIVFVLALVIIVLVSFFSYSAYVGNNEKLAMDNLSLTFTSASFGSLTTDTARRAAEGSVVVSIRFINPTDYDTPTFSVDFAWYISLSMSVNDGELCGTENITSMKIQSRGYKDLTFSLAFNLTGISAGERPLELFNAIQLKQVLILLGGRVTAGVFFNLAPVINRFLLSRSTSEINP